MSLYGGVVGQNFRVWYMLDDKGEPKGGIAADATVTVIKFDDAASTTATVTESTQQGGLYYFDIPGSFLTTHGAGKYGVAIVVSATGPTYKAVASRQLVVNQQDIDAISAASIAVAVRDQTGLSSAPAGSLGRAALLGLYLGHYGPGVWFDAFYGAAGTTIGVNGTADNPVSNPANVAPLLSALGLRTIYIRAGEWVIPAASGTTFQDTLVVGAGLSAGCRVDINGQDVAGMHILDCNVEGTLANSGFLFDLVCHRCSVIDLFDASGLFVDCDIHDIDVLGGAGLTLVDCHNPNESSIPAVITCGGATAATFVRIYGFEGRLQLEEVQHAGTKVEVAARSGFLDVRSTCTAGAIDITDGVELLNATGGATVRIVGRMQELVTDAVWDEVLTGATHNIQNSAGRRLRQLADLIVISEGTAQAGTANTITLAAGEPAISRIYDTNLITIVNGTGAGQARQILSYDGSTKIATVGRDWSVNPTAGSGYIIQAQASDYFMDNGVAQAGTSTTITLRSGGPVTDDLFAGEVIALQSGTGAGQARLIVAYNGTTKVATIEPAWDLTPDSTTGYGIVPMSRMGVSDAARVSIASEILTSALPSGELVEVTLDLLRKVHTNRLDAAPGNPGTLILYDDDTTTPIRTWPIRDHIGGAVIGIGGAPALRGQST